MSSKHRTAKEKKEAEYTNHSTNNMEFVKRVEPVVMLMRKDDEFEFLSVVA
jgi:hypothetical protein